MIIGLVTLTVAVLAAVAGLVLAIGPPPVLRRPVPVAANAPGPTPAPGSGDPPRPPCADARDELVPAPGDPPRPSWAHELVPGDDPGAPIEIDDGAPVRPRPVTPGPIGIDPFKITDSMIDFTRYSEFDPFVDRSEDHSEFDFGIGPGGTQRQGATALGGTAHDRQGRLHMIDNGPFKISNSMIDFTRDPKIDRSVTGTQPGTESEAEIVPGSTTPAGAGGGDGGSGAGASGSGGTGGGAALRATREYLGLPVRWLAAHLDVAERTVSRWEDDLAPIPPGVLDEVDYLDYSTGELEDDLAGLLHTDESEVPVLYTYRTDADMRAVDRDTPMPASWHRAMTARLARGDREVEIRYERH